MKPSMMMVALIIVLFLTSTVSLAFPADGSAPVPQTSTPVLDVVTLKDGSVIYGEVIEMSGGILQIKNALAGDIIKVKWAEVNKLAVSHPIPFHLKEGTILNGTVEEGDPGTMKVKAGPSGNTMTIPINTVTQVNPVIQPPVIYSGSLNAGYSQSTGNSHLRNVSILGDLVARSEQLRLTLLGRYVYGDNNGSLQVRNARGTIKLDFFITKRFFWFASAYVENDFLQNLKLRTAISSGPGYQFLERGDLNGIFKDMTFYAEAGPTYFNEDYRDNSLTGDRASFRARVAMKWDWPLFDGRITLYHYNEIFPSVQNASDFFFTMDNGVRMKILAGLASGFQVTTRYNNRPPAGTSDTDNLYLLTLGYAFDTTRTR
jgi:putative salt-induced outer membrane protein YdiY